MKRPNYPKDIASWMIYLGGMAMVIGNAIFSEHVWPAFWYGGAWTVVFALAYYEIGWWKENY